MNFLQPSWGHYLLLNGVGFLMTLLLVVTVAVFFVKAKADQEELKSGAGSVGAGCVGVLVAWAANLALAFANGYGAYLMVSRGMGDSGFWQWVLLVFYCLSALSWLGYGRKAAAGKSDSK